MFSAQPKVSCLMVTNDRFELVRRAVSSFQEQTYDNRELVILGEGDPTLAAYIRSLGDSKIAYHRAPRPGMTLGDLRNRSVELATGEFVMQWDDDDWSHPGRILLQLRTLERNNADYCILRRQTQVWEGRSLYRYSRFILCENTFLARKSIMAPYEPERRGEDTAQLMGCIRNGAKLCVVNAPDLYIYTYHGNNTWDAEHFEVIFSNTVEDVPQVRMPGVLRALGSSVSATNGRKP